MELLFVETALSEALQDEASAQRQRQLPEEGALT